MLKTSDIVKITWFLVAALIWFSATAGSKPDPSSLSAIKGALRKYQNAEAVSFEVKKTVRLALLDETKNYQGTLLLSRGQLRLEINHPEKSILIASDKLIWLITPAPKELGGKTQVLKISSSNFKKQAKAPLGLLLGRPSAWDQFSVSQSSQSERLAEYTLKPKAPDAAGEILKLKVEFRKPEFELTRISYVDSLDNETTFEFDNAKYNTELNGANFKYVPAADSDITEYK
jgi:outer membrane lipoprotein-sorting protein